MSQNATPATEFAPCRHLTQPCQCNLQKTRSTTRLRCCACHEKWRWTLPKCCACHENCNTSSENVAKVLRLPRKTTFDTLQNTSECHEVPRLPDGCARERNVERTHPQPPDPQSETGTLATHSGKTHPSRVWKQSRVYKDRSSTTSLSTFMPASAPLPCMRHLLAYLSRTFEMSRSCKYL